MKAWTGFGIIIYQRGQMPRFIGMADTLVEAESSVMDVLNADHRQEIERVEIDEWDASCIVKPNVVVLIGL